MTRMYNYFKKGQLGGGVLSLFLFFLVIAMFLSFGASTLNDISEETAGDTTDIAFNVTNNANISLQTFSGFLEPMSFLVVGGIFLFLIVGFLKK